MSKHTKGIWKVFICDDGGQWTGWPLSIYSTDNEKCVVRTGGQWPYNFDENISQAEAIANANLIAAAPELLEACRDFVNAVRARSKQEIMLAIDAADKKARAAIAKAKGE